MFFIHLLFALLVALIITFVFTTGLRRKGPWANVFLLLLIIFLATWAGGIWIAPLGPTIWDVYWFPFLLIGVVLAVFLAALPEERSRETVQFASSEEEVQKQEKKIVLSTFFWVLVSILIITIAARYFIDPTPAY